MRKPKPRSQLTTCISFPVDEAALWEEVKRQARVEGIGLSRFVRDALAHYVVCEARIAVKIKMLEDQIRDLKADPATAELLTSARSRHDR